MHMMHITSLDTRKRVVIVDDSASTRRLLATMLKTEGYVVYCFPDGSEVLKFFTNPAISAPDVMIIDAQMPCISGLTLVRRLRSKPHLSHMKIIMLTDGSILFHLRARLAGANFTLYKPIPISGEMLELLFEVIKALE